MSQNPKTLPGIHKKPPRIQKHFQESKLHRKNQKHIQESKTQLWILERVLDSGKCFLIRGRVFGFWEVFCPYEPR